MDELVSDFEDEDDKPKKKASKSKSKAKPKKKPTETSSNNANVIKGSGDAVGVEQIETSKQEPYIFRPSKGNVVSLNRFKDKLKSVS